MCELLGLCFNKEISPRISFQGFRERGWENPDGWGLACFEDSVCRVFKEAKSAVSSQLADFLINYKGLRGKIFIGHVRWKSRGEALLKNTHPFVRVFRQREIALAHNGTLYGNSLFYPKKFHPVGDTDSESILCALLSQMSNSYLRVEFTDFFEIQTILRNFNRFGKMNLLFSEGRYLYAYRDKNSYKSLWVTLRQSLFDFKQ